MNFQRIKRKLGSSYDFFKGKAKLSYSQFGEDILVDYILHTICKKQQISYLDIGTNDPVHGNNTYLFYLKNNFGVCVEPDPELYKKIVDKRPNDQVLHAGVGITEQAQGTLYIFPKGYTGWNTFSYAEAMERTAQSGIAYKEVPGIPFIPVNAIIEKYFVPCPDFISIDVEGLDFEILKSIDFSRFRPLVFCVETAEFSVHQTGKKNNDMIEFLLAKGYVIYADSFINTIFLRGDALSKQK